MSQFYGLTGEDFEAMPAGELTEYLLQFDAEVKRQKDIQNRG